MTTARAPRAKHPPSAAGPVVRREVLLESIDAWEAMDTVAARLEECRRMLFLHGYLRWSENDRIRLRLWRDYKAALQRSVPSIVGPVAHDGEDAKRVVSSERDPP